MTIAQPARRRSRLASPQGGSVRMDGQDVIMLGSNNYLGLAGDPAIRRAVIDAVESYGVGTGINPCFVQTPVHAELEALVATHLGTEDAVLFASCSAANAGVLATLAGEGDVICSDRMNHASIIDGGRLSRARVAVYDSCDPGGLERVLAAQPAAGTRLVITDGIFSMEGELAPLPALLSIARRAGATLVVDDSHATGVIGGTGAGSLELAGLAPGDAVITGTFSKALGGAPGGFVAASSAIAARLRDAARAFIFTAGMSIADAAASLAALKALRRSTEPLERLWDNTRLFRGLLRERGLAVADAPSPITPLLVGEAARATAIQARLLALGVYVPAMTYPIVGPHDARLRAQPSAALTSGQVRRAVDAIAQAFTEATP